VSFFLLSGGASTEAGEAFAAGADDCIRKPLDLAELDARLTRLEELRRLRAERKSTLPAPLEGDLNATLEAIELQLLEETLERFHYNQVKAAEALGITRGALQYKMKKYHLGEDDKKAA
jgi:DNA-binding NtrC family response regulator